MDRHDQNRFGHLDPLRWWELAVLLAMYALLMAVSAVPQGGRGAEAIVLQRLPLAANEVMVRGTLPVPSAFQALNIVSGPR